MTTRPQALRLADEIDPLIRYSLDNLTCSAAATELRRLHNEILVYHDDRLKLSNEVDQLKAALAAPVQKPVSMRMPKVGDRVVCIEDESLGTVMYLTAGGSPDIKFDDGSHGTYLLREFAELFGYTTPPAAQRWAVFCGFCRKQWSVPYQHPGKSICAECEARATGGEA